MTEEPCQCPDCQRFYREHDRLIREFPTLKEQQELNWASLQSFRTLCGKVSEELQKKITELETENKDSEINNHINYAEVTEALSEIENINAYLYSIEALMERIFEVKLPEQIESKFREVAGEIAPDPLNIDRLILNRLFHQASDKPDKETNPN